MLTTTFRTLRVWRDGDPLPLTIANKIKDREGEEMRGIIFICDRCRKEERLMVANYFNANLPPMWDAVGDNHLCLDCIKAFREFMEGSKIEDRERRRDANQGNIRPGKTSKTR